MDPETSPAEDAIKILNIRKIPTVQGLLEKNNGKHVKVFNVI